jgi:hypothetical protein
MARRRKLTTRSLLVASGSMVLACSGVTTKSDTGMVTGNLMPPPMIELCVVPTPAEAQIQIQGVDVDDKGCRNVYNGEIAISVTAEGHKPFSETVLVNVDTTHPVALEKAE